MPRVKVRLRYPRAEQLETARRNAALPPEEGGLGLPQSNTSLDRAQAMGYTMPLYHGTFADFDLFDPYYGDVGFHFGSAEQANNRLKDLQIERNGGYKSRAGIKEFDEGANIWPVVINPGRVVDRPDVGMWKDSVTVANTLPDTMYNYDLLDEIYQDRQMFVDSSDWLESPENRTYLEEIGFKIPGDTIRYQNQVENTYGSRTELLPDAQKRLEEIRTEIDEIRARADSRIGPLPDDATEEQVQAWLKEMDNRAAYLTADEHKRIADLQDEDISINRDPAMHGDPNSYIVKDLSRIRLRNAAFDPARRDDWDPLATVAPLGIAGIVGAGAMGEEAEAAPRPKLRYQRRAAMEEAQRNAALPPEEGGLGLRPDNTRAERSVAMYPRRGYHGTAPEADYDEMKGTTWMSETPDLANSYANVRAFMKTGDSESAAVMPLRMDPGNVFNADRLPNSVQPGEYFGEAFRQAQARGQQFSEDDLARARALIQRVRNAGRREESGPYYARHDFWYDTPSYFGRDGAEAVEELWDLLGVDSFEMTEGGQKTIGTRDPARVRSVNAAFDPKKRTSRNILASGPTVGIAGIAGLGGDEAEAGDDPLAEMRAQAERRYNDYRAKRTPEGQYPENPDRRQRARKKVEDMERRVEEQAKAVRESKPYKWMTEPGLTQTTVGGFPVGPTDPVRMVAQAADAFGIPEAFLKGVQGVPMLGDQDMALTPGNVVKGGATYLADETAQLVDLAREGIGALGRKMRPQWYPEPTTGFGSLDSREDVREATGLPTFREEDPETRLIRNLGEPAEWAIPAAWAAASGLRGAGRAASLAWDDYLRELERAGFAQDMLRLR